MDWNSFLHKGILRGGLCVLLILAMVLGLVLPGLGMQTAQPENPMEEEGIREITVLQAGENVSELNTIVVPNGGSAAPTEPNETNPDETNPDETQPEETIPEETESEEPDIGDGEEGNEDGNQGEEGGELLDLDLAAAMTWYQYGNQAKTIVCSPDRAVSKSLNLAQLINNELEYSFRLTGADAEYVEITSVSVAEGDSIYREVSESGSMDIQLPGGATERRYTFQVKALAEKENDAGETVQQELTFLFVMKCSYSMDLEMGLSWKKNDGRENTITCGPDKAEAFSVQNYELTERVFNYTAKLTGALADNARIVEASYTTASGQQSGTLEVDGGALILYPAPGSDTETYYLTFTVETPDRMVLYTYNLVYQEMLDVQLSFNWTDRGLIEHSMTCQPEGTVSERIKNNQLSAGAVAYEIKFTGADAEHMSYFSAAYISETESGTLEKSGSLAMTMPEGSTSNTYRITVNALVKGQRMTFQIILYYANDVTLQMEYSVQEDGVSTQRYVACENTKTKTAEAIYDDQLSGGMLDYRMTIAGSDADSVSITSVSCYQTGTGKTQTLSDTGTVELQLQEGKTGENTFTVRAEDDAGNEYTFVINIPYKHRGEQSIKIETNLEDGQEIINGTKTNLTVKAWTEDAAGNVVDYIPANGVDTKLVVRLDNVEIAYTSTSGASSEYDLIPENPEVGDTNTHILEIYAEDAYGEYGELTLTLNGLRREAGQKAGTATIYVDMSVLGLGVVDSVTYEVLADEPVSYVIAKAILGEDTGDPFGAAKDTLGWNGSYAGTLEDGFYLQSLTTGHSANALEDSSWPGSTEEEVLEAIDSRFGEGTGLATLWRCLYRNGLNKSSGSGGSFGEFDYTSGSGWMYSIGGTNYYPGQSMSAVYLQDGDVLTLRYTLAYGWDVGGGTPGYGNSVGYCVSAVNGSFHISHQMETVTGEGGNEIHVCHCCGLVQDCAHNNLTWLDLEDGTHIQYCSDCKATVGDPQKHNWNEDAQTDNHICEDCGASEAHIWKEIAGTNTATCTEAGTRQVRCVICEVTKEEETPAKGHTFDSTWYAELTEHYQICSTCGEEHSHGEHTFAYSDEWDDYMCGICGALHDWGETGCTGIIENGRCSECGAEAIDYEPDETEPDETDPDESEPDVSEPEETDPSEPEHTHSYETVEEQESTCEEAGYVIKECKCGDRVEQTLPKAECNFVVTDEMPSTCTEQGWQDFECSGCGATKYVILDFADHQMTEWEITEEPDVGVPGERYRYCENCDYEETQIIDPLPEESEQSLFARFFWRTAI